MSTRLSIMGIAFRSLDTSNKLSMSDGSEGRSLAEPDVNEFGMSCDSGEGIGKGPCESEGRLVPAKGSLSKTGGQHSAPAFGLFPAPGSWPRTLRFAGGVREHPSRLPSAPR